MEVLSVEAGDRIAVLSGVNVNELRLIDFLFAGTDIIDCGSATSRPIEQLNNQAQSFAQHDKPNPERSEVRSKGGHVPVLGEQTQPMQVKGKILQGWHRCVTILELDSHRPTKSQGEPTVSNHTGPPDSTKQS